MQVIQRAATDVGATSSTCPYCGVGCGVLIESQDGRIVGVRGDPAHPANQGRLCSKGANLHLTATPEVLAHARLLQPMQRVQRGAAPMPVSWDAAMSEAATRLADVVRRHGPDALGFYVSGQFLTEDYYVFNKLVKGLLGSNQIDSNSRLCMSSAVAGYKATLGADAPPACYDDVNHAGCIFIAGANPAWAHPILFRRIEAAKAHNPDLKIVLVDPRRTDSAEVADLVLQLQPGTDVLLFHGLLHIMLWEGWVDADFIAAHTEGFAELKALVRDCTPERVAQVCGLRVPDLLLAARWFAGVGDQGLARRPTLSLYCQGLNQSSSGTDKNTALIHLHLATGQIGVPGAGPLSLTGQPNAMGGREVGGMANLLSAHRELGNVQHRAEVAALWGVPSVPDKPGRTAVEMFQAAADGEVKALWIACTNPAQSLPDQRTVRRALERAEFVVVQEAFATTATCAYADLLLPATTWGEKDGTVTNSERCISRVRAAVPPPGVARHDWQIGVDLAQRLEAVLKPGEPTRFAYATPESVWNEHRESTRGRDLDITGMSYALLDAAGPLVWPMPAGAPTGQARLYTDRRFATASGKARFVTSAYRPLSEPADARYPLTLNTGRLRDQWHGMSRSGVVAQAFGHSPEPVVQLHPLDLQRRGLRDGDLARVRSRRDTLVAPVQGCKDLRLGQAFMAMHWGSEVLGGRDDKGQPMAGVNALTLAAYCQQSRQPELKAAAVDIAAVHFPWQLAAMAWLAPEAVLPVRSALQALLAPVDFALCVPVAATGGDRVGVSLRAAHAQAPEGALLDQIEVILGLASTDTLRYADARLGQRRCVTLDGTGTGRRLRAFLLAGDIRSNVWLRALLQNADPVVGNDTRRLLLAQTDPPVATSVASKLVCACWGVTETRVAAQLKQSTGSADEKLAQLQQHLKCGTQCGSCLPELKRMTRAA